MFCLMRKMLARLISAESKAREQKKKKKEQIKKNE